MGHNKCNPASEPFLSHFFLFDFIFFYLYIWFFHLICSYMWYFLSLYVITCAIWYHLYNSKNVKNIHGGVLLFVKLQAILGNREPQETSKVIKTEIFADLMQTLYEPYFKSTSFTRLPWMELSFLGSMLIFCLVIDLSLSMTVSLQLTFLTWWLEWCWEHNFFLRNLETHEFRASRYCTLQMLKYFDF